MNEDTLNLEIRRFLKEFGVSAQREIEKSVRAAQAGGALPSGGKVRARARLEVEGLDASLVVERELSLG